MSIVVNVHNGAGFTAYARLGSREHVANSSSPELAARLAAAGVAGREVADITVERKQPGLRVATPKPERR